MTVTEERLAGSTRQERGIRDDARGMWQDDDTPVQPGAVGFATPAGPASAAWAGVTIRHYAQMWRRYSRHIIAITALTLVGGVTRTFLTPRMYMAQATILPSGGQSQSGVMGLIASFTGGPGMMGGADEGSSALFPKILHSRGLCVAVMNTKFRFLKDGQEVQMTLTEFLGQKSEDEGLRALEGIRTVDVDKETGVLAVNVQTPYPDLSAAVANRFVEALEKFSLEARRKSASDNGVFIRERLEQSMLELTKAEEALTVFKEQNIRLNDPQLELERLRLEREATLKNQVYITLNNQAEIARIEETKSMPVVRILDHAVVPALPLPRPLVAVVIGSLILGCVLSGLAVAGLEFFQFVRRELQNV